MDSFPLSAVPSSPHHVPQGSSLWRPILIPQQLLILQFVFTDFTLLLSHMTWLSKEIMCLLKARIISNFAFYLVGCQKYFVKNNSLFSSLELEIFGPTELLVLSFLLRFNFASGYLHELLGFIPLKSLLPSQGRVDQARTLIPRAISFIFWPEMNLQLTRSVVTVHFFPLWNTLWRIAFHLPLLSLLRILTPLLTPDLHFIKQLK